MGRVPLGGIPRRNRRLGPRALQMGFRLLGASWYGFTRSTCFFGTEKAGRESSRPGRRVPVAVSAGALPPCAPDRAEGSLASAPTAYSRLERGGRPVRRGELWGSGMSDRLRFGIFHGPVPPGRREPDSRPAARPRPHRPPRSARLGRGVDRRAPLGRLRDHRLPGDLHRHGRRTDPTHQARHGRGERQLPQSALGGRAGRAARSSDPRPFHARPRARLPADRRHDGRPRPEPDPRAAGRVRRDHHPAAAHGRAGHLPERPVGPARGPPAPAALRRIRSSRSQWPPWPRRPARSWPASTASACCRSAPPRPPASTPWPCTGALSRNGPRPSARTSAGTVGGWSD